MKQKFICKHGTGIYHPTWPCVWCLEDESMDKEEAMEILIELVNQCCFVDGFLNSCGISSYADAIRYLAKIGKVEIVKGFGDAIIGRFVDPDKLT